METHGPDLTGLALTAAAAVLAGLGLRRLGQPSIVGYILVGVLLGPSAGGLVDNSENVAALAELGVVMLLFLIGMELSIRGFVRVLKPATIVALGQIAASVAIAFAFGTYLGWPVAQSLVIGFIIALSSTAVAITLLDQIDELRGPIGQITIGVLIAQDIAVVPILIVVGSLGGEELPVRSVSVKVAMAIALLGILLYWLSRRGKIHLPFSAQLEGKVDLLTLATLAFCFTAAAFTGLLGLSPVFGAFCAGLLMGGSTLRAETIRVTEPIQSVLLVVFFLSVGLLIDIDYVVANVGTVILFTVVVLMLKTALNVVLLRVAGETWDSALQSGLIMAQIGEFSFVLAATALATGALSGEGHRLAITVIAATLLLSPVWADAVRRVHGVALRGVTDFRAALAEIYAEEIAVLERGAAPVGQVFRRSRQRLKAARMAFAQRRNGTAPEAEVTSAAGPVIHEVSGQPDTASSSSDAPDRS